MTRDPTLDAICQAFPALHGVVRRDMLKFLGAAIALAGLDGCERRPNEEAYPYVETPEGEVPGIARFYATMVECDGIAQPLIGKTHDGRPIKLDGNPNHPASGGASDAFTQAALLGLYDPDRSGSPLEAGKPSNWETWDAQIAHLRSRCNGSRGAGVRLLTSPVGSPALRAQIARLLAQWPQAQWHEQRVLADMGRERLVLEHAQTVISLDHDFLGPGPLQTYHATGWGKRRQAFHAGNGAAQLFVAEPSPTITGVAAENRLSAREDRMGTLLTALARQVGLDMGNVAPPLNPREERWVVQASAALQARPGSGLVIVGPHHPPAIHDLAIAIDRHVGNFGKTRFHLPTPGAPEANDFPALMADMTAGKVDTLFMLDVNPAYASGQAAAFVNALQKVPFSFHAGLYADETGSIAHWHAPLAHALESWNDGEAADGSVLVGQPLVRAWLPVRSRHAIMAQLLGDDRVERDIVRGNWPHLASAQAWEQALTSGCISPAPLPALPGTAPAQSKPIPTKPQSGLALVLRPDPSVWDGQFANNPWLQELPKPLTKIAWQNAVHIGPALAQRRGLNNGDLVKVSVNGVGVEGPVWIIPGQDNDTILLHYGGGRRTGGKVARGVGFDAWPLAGASGEATLVAIGGNQAVCTTQHHFTMAGHDFIRFVDRVGTPLPPSPRDATFYPAQRSDPAWGMAIDLDLCIGCNACAVACVAENNVPMVGREQVAMGRAMHWLRIDSYREGDVEDPIHAFQPVPCMHCEDAPCEMGCPVNATVHSPDGLNLQVYNRCIGTRTCSAYCPYKVRRFNWFDLTHDDPPELRAARNPDVTVRGRGVMEKCTYCIQRISAARIAADKDDRPIADGEIVTACQAACPTQAIVFGNIADKASEVSQRKANGRDYDLLPEANTRPRTTYGARIRSGEERG